MRRREFIIAGLAWTVPAHAKQASKPIVGFFRSTPSSPFRHAVAAFHNGLSQMGFVEGANVAVEYRYADNDVTRLPSLATDLISRGPAVIVGNLLAVQAVRAADPTIPLVFVVGDDPVKMGLVASLNRPGGDATGIIFFGGGALDAKRLEMLHEIDPRQRTFGVLLDSDYPEAERGLPSLREAARSLGREIVVVKVSANEIKDGFDRLVAAQVGVVLISGSPVFSARRPELVALAARHRLPASYDQREFVDAGGLMSYGASFADAYRQAGVYVGRILKGEKPSELPVAQPTTFELVINLRTVKALGLTIPPTLLARADEVIE
jgi:putative ABC transport system substrate-binding protein